MGSTMTLVHRSPAAKAAIFTGTYATLAGLALTLAPVATFGKRSIACENLASYTANRHWLHGALHPLPADQHISDALVPLQQARP